MFGEHIQQVNSDINIKYLDRNSILILNYRYITSRSENKCYDVTAPRGPVRQQCSVIYL